VDLLNLNVAPIAVFQMLKSMCAGQRLASDSQDPAAVSLPTSNMPETRGQDWAPVLLAPIALVAGHRSGWLGSEWLRPVCQSLPRTCGPICRMGP
jgi:mitotic-spindle organizing protein 2A/2B